MYGFCARLALADVVETYNHLGNLANWQIGSLPKVAESGEHGSMGPSHIDDNAG
jgi:hypothetical protein